MSSIGESKQDFFTGVAVFRNRFSLARHFFDLHIYDDGIAGYYIWARNEFRFPIIHPISDWLKRGRRDRLERDDAVAQDYRNFSFTYDEIQGIVTYKDHKEIMILTNEEQITFHFRPLDEYDRFVDHLKASVPEKYFSRDDVEITHSVYIS